ncbi:MAG: rhomboid family intramembrane serine protease [Alphaproteobacteria bacterium]
MRYQKSITFFNLPNAVVLWALVMAIIFLLVNIFSLFDKTTIIQQYMFLPWRDWQWQVFSGIWPYQIITYGFLHGNISHLLFNVVVGVVFSKVIYDALSGWGWGFVFFTGLCGGAIFHLLTTASDIGIIGSSAGVAAWIGASLFLAVNDIAMPPPFETKSRAMFFIIFFLALNFLTALTANRLADTAISNAGHLGGLVFGYLAAWGIILITSHLRR